MPRYVGHKDGKICVVSDMMIESSDLKWAKVPDRMDDVSEKELVVGYYVDDDKVESKSAKKLVEHLRLAFVSNYAMKCGISTYAEHLLPKLVPLVADYKLFIEEDISQHDEFRLDNIPIQSDKISVCWKRGESLSRLADEIKAYNPDVVVINHEWGLFSNARYWLSLLTQLSRYRVIVIMHSVFGHMDKLVCEAAMKEIVVHSNEARNMLLNDKGISGEVHMVPHGCYPTSTQRPLWNIYRSDHTFVQTGFGFRYKNFEASITAVSLLKSKYPDIFFTGIFSESDYAKDIHSLYYDELMGLVKKLGIENHVAIIRGYQSDTVIDSYFRTNKVSVFPYHSTEEHKVFGASGSARLAMAYKIPVITSNLPHFGDLPTIKVGTAEELAKELDSLFASQKKQAEQIERQTAFIQENGWDITAKRFLSVLNPTQYSGIIHR